MSAYDWTATGLPPPSISFSPTAATSSIRSTMDSGRPRIRRRFTSGLMTIGVSWQLNDIEFAAFQAIYLFKIDAGADKFTISLPLGDGFKTYTAQFGEDGWAASYKEVMNWTITSKLLVESICPITEAALDDLLPLNS